MFESLTNMWSGLTEMFSQVAEVFSAIVENLIMFNTLLTDNITLMGTMTEQINNNTLTGGLAWFDFIATFHWLVGSPIYYLFFAFIIFGLSVTIYQIIYMIYNHIPVGSIIGGLRGRFFT